MENKYVVLRSNRSATRDIFFGPSALPDLLETTYPELQAEVNTLERRQVVELSHDRDVVAIAPAMPMKLIAPVGTAKPLAPGTDTMTWGVKAVKADTSPYTGAGIIVAVLDTGIDAKHPAFKGVKLVQKDFTKEGNGDREGHGTHCAGTIFGREVNGLRIGVAPGIEKALIGKVLGREGGSSEQIANAILWAVDNGANIISMSLGIDFPGYVAWLVAEQGMPAELATTVALEGYRANVQLFQTLAAYTEARSTLAQATVIVAAAGNESQRDVRPDWEIAVAPPAVSKGIVSVAALGESPEGLTIASFSNTGANISGPGVDVLSAAIGGGLVAYSGTSMATPHVAGVAALWAEKLKQTGRLNSLALTSRVIASATDETLKPDFDPVDVGTGLVQAPQK